MKKQSQQASKNMNTINDFTLDYYMKLIRLGIKKSGILNKNAFWEESDLLSAGYLALASAIESYNEEKQASFESYVITCISNALKDMNNKEGYTIRVPRTKDKEGNYLTAYSCYALDEWMENGYDHAEESSIVEMVGWMNDVINESGLTERERMVMEAKYGVGEYEEKWSSEELATELKITTQSVNRICRNAMEKVRGVGLGFHAVGA
jgi:RNA polymerase sigma factor (sigma-70 family)